MRSSTSAYPCSACRKRGVPRHLGIHDVSMLAPAFALFGRVSSVYCNGHVVAGRLPQNVGGLQIRCSYSTDVWPACDFWECSTYVSAEGSGLTDLPEDPLFKGSSATLGHVSDMRRMESLRPCGATATYAVACMASLMPTSSSSCGVALVLNRSYQPCRPNQPSEL